MRVFTILTCLVASTTAFQIGIPSTTTTRPQYSNSVVGIANDANTVKTALSAMRDPDIKTAGVMDDLIYDFNKVVIDTVYDIICLLYPVTGEKRDFARFYVLETVARVPYFAYLSVMHLRETFGERCPELSERMRTHYAEADNELHHLLIMESLGGNSSFVDRTVAQSMAFGYYWYVVAVYSFSEQAAYHLSELIEDHAYETYDNYLKDHEDMLKSLPVPEIATKYYIEDNPFLFDLFCTVKNKDEEGNYSDRRPTLESLYDVFVNVRNDEKEHWKTLCNLVQYNDMQGAENKDVHGTTKASFVEALVAGEAPKPASAKKAYPVVNTKKITAPADASKED